MEGDLLLSRFTNLLQPDEARMVLLAKWVKDLVTIHFFDLLQLGLLELLT